MRIRSISRNFWLAQGFISLCFATGYSDDAPVKSVPLTNKIFEALARPLQNQVASALNAGEMSQVPAASDPELNKVLNETLGKILLKKVTPILPKRLRENAGQSKSTIHGPFEKIIIRAASSTLSSPRWGLVGLASVVLLRRRYSLVAGPRHGSLC